MSAAAAPAAVIPPPAPEPRLVDQKTTYLLIANDEHEERITRHFITKKYGDIILIKAQIVRGIPAARLTELNTVIPILRSILRPVTKTLPAGQTNIPETYHVDLDTLVQDVRERAPLRIADFWREGGEMGGFLDEGKFREALNKIASPFTVNYRGDEGIYRLGHC